MEKKITKRVVVEVVKGGKGTKTYRENTIDLIQTYEDSSKKLKGTRESARIEGRLFRLARKGEKYEERLMDEASWEVLSLVAIPNSVKTGPQVFLVEIPTDPPATPLVDALQLSEPKSEEVAVLGTDSLVAQIEGAAPKELAKVSPPKTKTKKVRAAKASKASKASKAAKTPKAAKPPQPDQPASGTKPVEFNPNEEAVLAALAAEPQTIKNLAAAVFPAQQPVKANSWVRNSLRKLVLTGKVAKVDRGTYAVTGAS